jgi:hypothetical protein
MPMQEQRPGGGVARTPSQPRTKKFGGPTAPLSGAFTPKKTRYQLYRRPGGPRGRPFLKGVNNLPFYAGFNRFESHNTEDVSSSSIGTTTLSWVSACSTAVEHSQQEGFYRVPLPAAHPTPNLEENRRCLQRL